MIFPQLFQVEGFCSLW